MTAFKIKNGSNVGYTSAEIATIVLSLTMADAGTLLYDKTLNQTQVWNGIALENIGSAGTIVEAPENGRLYSRGNGDWSLSPTEGDGAYYFTNVASDLGGGRYEMIKGIPPGGGFGIANVGVLDGDILAEFASVDGFPNTTDIPSGPLTFYIDALKTGGTQTAKLYAEFYTRTIAGVNTLIATSTLTEELIGSNLSVGGYASMPVVKGLLDTDRLLVIIKAEVSGAGTAPDITLNIQGNTNARTRYPFNIDVDGKLNIPSANNGELLYQTAPGVIVGTPTLSINTYEGLSGNFYLEPDNGGYDQINNFYTRIEPIQNSPNEIAAIVSIDTDIDTLIGGFDFGTNGASIKPLSMNVNHQGTSALGRLELASATFNLGNGTDAVDVYGWSYYQAYGTIANNCTISQGMSGYNYAPFFDVGSIIDVSNSWTNAFYDGADLSNVISGSYNSFSANPNIGTISNNRNFSGFTVNPTIPNFDGNGSFIGVGVYGNLGTFDVGGSFQGVNINPNIASVENATGLNIFMGGVTGTNVKAADISGDVNIQGAMNFTGDLSLNGSLDAFNSYAVVNGSGNPESIQNLVSQVTAQNAVTSTNVDVIGANGTMLCVLEEDSVTTASPFKLGFASLVGPVVLNTGLNSSLDYVNMIAGVLNLDPGSAGGTVDRVNGVRIEAIPNGITTINEFAAFEFNQSFGQVGTDVWGLHIVPSYAENFIAGSLNIGSATEKVSNSDVAFEIGSLKAFLNARLTTAERDALTAIDGMQIYNTTTSKLQVRASGSWVDLH